MSQENTQSTAAVEESRSAVQPDYIENIEFDTDDELINVPVPKGVNVSGDTNELDAYRCIVCKMAPFGALYQCHNGHNICGGCYQIRVLDKMLGSELGTCPRCAVRIYRHEPYRNFNGERALADLIVACHNCGVHLPRGRLRKHGQVECPKRLVACKYRRLGCKWSGAVGEDVPSHEKICEFRGKQGVQMLEMLQQRQQERDAKQFLLGKIMKLLQLPHITVRLLQLLPHAVGFPRNTFKSGSVFEAFSQRWCIQLKWQTTNDAAGSTADQQNSNCSVLFRMCLESPEVCRGLGLTYTLVSGTYSDVRFRPNLCEKFDFNSDNVHGPPTLLYKNTLQNCDRLLNERGLFARLLMARI